MKTHIVMYFSSDSVHQIWKIVEEDHDKAVLEAYKRYNRDWNNESDPSNKELKEDFYRNTEVVAIVDGPLNSVVLTYHNLVYIMPEIDPKELE